MLRSSSLKRRGKCAGRHSVVSLAVCTAIIVCIYLLRRRVSPRAGEWCRWKCPCADAGRASQLYMGRMCRMSANLAFCILRRVYTDAASSIGAQYGRCAALSGCVTPAARHKQLAPTLSATSLTLRSSCLALRKLVHISCILTASQLKPRCQQAPAIASSWGLHNRRRRFSPLWTPARAASSLEKARRCAAQLLI